MSAAALVVVLLQSVITIRAWAWDQNRLMFRQTSADSPLNDSTYPLRHGSPPITVGRASTAAGLSVKAVRLHEARGLLATRPRTTAGYRLYTDADIDRLCLMPQPGNWDCTSIRSPAFTSSSPLRAVAPVRGEVWRTN